ncbi:Uncharacterised protein [Clostridium perfringens]|uniref:Uncharacterized protein n=1 Tax=Clostridium perfringens TaxID=1502 RepID=A0A2X3ACF7_CLOPF|nr:hypothetical protein [Clostridium perfringens]SQB59900.1 Uncharacterised protein [Clostridium perfringens]
MNWEEELVIKNRKLKFDKNLIDRAMCNIVNNIMEYADKYKVNLHPSYVSQQYLDIGKENKVRVLFSFLDDDTLRIKIDNASLKFATISLNGYYCTVEYNNLNDEDKPNYKTNYYYNLSEEILSEVIGNVLRINKEI